MAALGSIDHGANSSSQHCISGWLILSKRRNPRPRHERNPPPIYYRIDGNFQSASGKRKIKSPFHPLQSHQSRIAKKQRSLSGGSPPGFSNCGGRSAFYFLKTHPYSTTQNFIPSHSVAIGSSKRKQLTIHLQNNISMNVERKPYIHCQAK